MAGPPADAAQRDLLESGPTLRILQAAVDTLLDGAPPELAVELREDLPDLLKGATRPYNAEAPATVDGFLYRFRQRSGLGEEGLLHEAQIAIALIGDMLTGETLGDLRASFPEGFGVLFERRATPDG